MGGRSLIGGLEARLGLFEREGLTGELRAGTNYSNTRSKTQNLLMAVAVAVVAS
jgi:hypothetical protein